MRTLLEVNENAFCSTFWCSSVGFDTCFRKSTTWCYCYSNYYSAGDRIIFWWLKVTWHAGQENKKSGTSTISFQRWTLQRVAHITGFGITDLHTVYDLWFVSCLVCSGHSFMNLFISCLSSDSSRKEVSLIISLWLLPWEVCQSGYVCDLLNYPVGFIIACKYSRFLWSNTHNIEHP